MKRIIAQSRTDPIPRNCFSYAESCSCCFNALARVCCCCCTYEYTRALYFLWGSSGGEIGQILLFSSSPFPAVFLLDRSFGPLKFQNMNYTFWEEKKKREKNTNLFLTSPQECTILGNLFLVWSSLWQERSKRRSKHFLDLSLKKEQQQSYKP